MLKRHAVQIAQRVESLPVLGSLLSGLRYPVNRILFALSSSGKKQLWRDRTQEVIRCPDNMRIARVDKAGLVMRGQQVMHNGLRIAAGSIYGEPMRLLLFYNSGVHEPQEEWAFQEVLRHIPARGTMIELGAYWGFYSLWFASVVADARCFLVEPESFRLKYGQTNFASNGMTADFTQAFVGRVSVRDARGVPTVSVDDFLTEHALAHVDILHADIQGSEYDMLLGAGRALAAGKIDYLFVSTHAEHLHQQCCAHLIGLGYEIVVDVDLPDSYSVDGIIVAKHPRMTAPRDLIVSKKRIEESRLRGVSA